MGHGRETRAEYPSTLFYPTTAPRDGCYPLHHRTQKPRGLSNWTKASGKGQKWNSIQICPSLMTWILSLSFVICVSKWHSFSWVSYVPIGDSAWHGTVPSCTQGIPRELIPERTLCSPATGVLGPGCPLGPWELWKLMPGSHLRILT